MIEDNTKSRTRTRGGARALVRGRLPQLQSPRDFEARPPSAGFAAIRLIHIYIYIYIYMFIYIYIYIYIERERDRYTYYTRYIRIYYII